MLGAICGEILGSTYEVKMKDDLFSDAIHGIKSSPCLLYI